MRCLSLAVSLREKGYDCHFLSRELPGNLIKVIKSRGFNTHTLKFSISRFGRQHLKSSNPSDPIAWLGENPETEIAQVSSVLSMNNYDWVVVDNYAIGEEWERVAKQYVKRLLVIDDLETRNHFCDIFINQNFNAEMLGCKKNLGPDSMRLLGPKYALLRNEFLEERSKRSPTPFKDRDTPARIFVCMGRNDNGSHTNWVIEQISASGLGNHIDLKVVSACDREKLSQIIERNRPFYFKATLHYNPRNMAALMNDCDFAIGAGGVNALERCCMGLPSITIVTAENQYASAFGAKSLGIAEVLLGNKKDPESFKKVLRAFILDKDLKSMGDRCKEIVDGRGISRVLNAVQGILN